MARSRMTKPEYYIDEKIAKLSLPARYLFKGTWNFADDYGVVRGNPLYLKSQIFPYDNYSVDEISGYLKEIEDQKLVIPATYNSEKYYLITNFQKHQTINKPSKTRNVPEECMNIFNQSGKSLEECSSGVVVLPSETKKETKTETKTEKEKEEEIEPEIKKNKNNVKELNDYFYNALKELNIPPPQDYLFIWIKNAAKALNQFDVSTYKEAIDWWVKQGQYRPSVLSSYKDKPYPDYIKLITKFKEKGIQNNGKPQQPSDINEYAKTSNLNWDN